MLSNKEPCTQSKGFDFSVMRAANGRYSSDSPLNKMGRSGAVVAVGIATVVIGVTVSYKFSVGGDVAFSSVHRILNVVDAEEPFPPLFPFRFADYVGFCLAILGLLLAAGAGVGDIVIASEAKQSSFFRLASKLDCFVASAPRNDGRWRIAQ